MEVPKVEVKALVDPEYFDRGVSLYEKGLESLSSGEEAAAGQTIIAGRPPRYADIATPAQAIAKERVERLLIGMETTPQLIRHSQEKHTYLVAGSADLGEVAQSEIATTLFDMKDVLDERIRSAPKNSEGLPLVEGISWSPGDPLAGVSEAISPFHMTNVWATYLRTALPPVRLSTPRKPALPQSEERTVLFTEEEGEDIVSYSPAIDTDLPTQVDIEFGSSELTGISHVERLHATDFAKIDHSLFADVAKVGEIGHQVAVGIEIFASEEAMHAALGAVGVVAVPPVLMATGLFLALVEIAEANEHLEVARRRSYYYSVVALGIAAQMDPDYVHRIPANPLMRKVYDRARDSIAMLGPTSIRQVRAALIMKVANPRPRTLEAYRTYMKGSWYYTAALAFLVSQDSLTAGEDMSWSGWLRSQFE